VISIFKAKAKASDLQARVKAKKGNPWGQRQSHANGLQG